VGLFAAISVVALTHSVLRQFWKGEDTKDIESRGEPFMKRTVFGGGQLLLGVAIVAGTLQTIHWLSLKKREGVLIRPSFDAVVLGRQAPSDGGPGRIHVGSPAGYFCVDEKSKQRVEADFPPSRDLRGIRDLAWKGGALFLACRNGLLRAERGKIEKLPLTGPTTSILLSRDGQMLVGGVGRIFLSEGETLGAWEALGTDRGVTLSQVTLLYEDRKGTVWAGCDAPGKGGLIRRRKGELQFSDASRGLPHASVCDLCEDGSGQLWAATGFAATGGAACWDETSGQWNALVGPPGLERKKIRSLFFDSRQFLWFCSEYDGIALRSDKGWTNCLFRDGFPCREVKDTIETEEGFWMATERGVIFLARHPSDTVGKKEVETGRD